jgi:hypothetical protein
MILCESRFWIVPLAVGVLLIQTRIAEAGDAPSPEPSIEIYGLAGPLVRMTASELKKLPHLDVTAVDHGGKSARYAGVALRVLLDKAGIPAGEKLRGRWLRAYVAIDATDHYRAVFALAELDPSFTDRTILLADTRDGQPLDPRHGPFQIIVPGEKKQARWVRMVNAIRVVDSRPAK